jgi:predicted amidohydrolase YtcJ
MELVARHLPPLDLEDHIAGLRRGMAMANRFGITSVLEASADTGVLAAYRALAERGELTFRVVAAQRVDLARGPEQVAAMVERRAQTAERFRPIAAKIFADGVIESGTAALLEPYVGRPGRGKMNIEPRALEAMVGALDRGGLDVHIHAIGDRAIRASLDAFAAAAAANPARDRRHSIAHLQLIDPADVERFAGLGVIADFQPLWAYADRYITELTEPFLGPERSRWLYPIKSVVDTGAVVVAGSDWSVSSMNPLEAIQVGR